MCQELLVTLRSLEESRKHLMSRGFRRFGYLDSYGILIQDTKGVGFKHSLESNNYSCSVHRFARTSVEKNNAVGWDAFRTGLQEG